MDPGASSWQVVRWRPVPGPVHEAIGAIQVRIGRGSVELPAVTNLLSRGPAGRRRGCWALAGTSLADAGAPIRKRHSRTTKQACVPEAAAVTIPRCDCDRVLAIAADDRPYPGNILAHTSEDSRIDSRDRAALGRFAEGMGDPLGCRRNSLRHLARRACAGIAMNIRRQARSECCCTRSDRCAACRQHLDPRRPERYTGTYWPAGRV